MARVDLKNVSLNYHTLAGEVKALEGINLAISDQEFVAIVGQSGCGKSTLLSLISGLLKPTRALSSSTARKCRASKQWDICSRTIICLSGGLSWITHF